MRPISSITILVGLVALSACCYASHIDRRQNGPKDPGFPADCTYSTDAVAGDTCKSLAEFWGITRSQFVDYNPSVKGDCSGFVVGHQYCVERAGGAVTTTKTTSETTTTPAPSPTQSGLVANCNKFYKVQSGDTCQVIVDKFGTFTLSLFYKWNPAVGATCASLQLDVYVCIGVPGTPTQATTTNGPTTTPRGPQPQQTGITRKCSKYYSVKDGDNCQDVVDKYGTFTLADFYKWNPAVGPDCRKLISGYYVCVGTKGSSQTTTRPTTTTKTPSGPSPTQTGIRKDCTKYYIAKSGDTCDVIAAKYGTFTTSQFISWNPAVGSTCSKLLAGYYYCVAIPGTPTTRISTQKPTPTHSGPQPQQPGIIKSCNKYYFVQSGETCDLIVGKKGLTKQQFYAWNTGINAQCTNLQANVYVCIGIS